MTRRHREAPAMPRPLVAARALSVTAVVVAAVSIGLAIAHLA